MKQQPPGTLSWQGINLHILRIEKDLPPIDRRLHQYNLTDASLPGHFLINKSNDTQAYQAIHQHAL